jgi:hypothetical protein
MLLLPLRWLLRLLWLCFADGARTSAPRTHTRAVPGGSWRS